jgi:hypothetical protein
VRNLFQGYYTYHGGTWPDVFAITVEGDPNIADSRVVVRARDGEHAATVGTIDTLPEEYRAAAGEALKGAVQAAKLRLRLRGNLTMPTPPAVGQMGPYSSTYPVPIPGWPDFDQYMAPAPGSQNPALESIQEQLERLGQRMDRLEQRYRDQTGAEVH